LKKSELPLKLKQNVFVKKKKPKSWRRNALQQRLKPPATSDLSFGILKQNKRIERTEIASGKHDRI
jgi:hypothetical protein